MRIFLLKRKELLQNLVKYGTIGASSYQRVGVIVPSFADAKLFQKDFLDVLDEVPKWMRPKLFRCNIREITFDNYFEIRVFCDESGSRGMSVTELWASSRATDEQIAPHCFSIITHGFTRFEDE